MWFELASRLLENGTKPSLDFEFSNYWNNFSVLHLGNLVSENYRKNRSLSLRTETFNLIGENAVKA